MTGSEIALIVGVGSGLSASIARLFQREGMRIALAARRPDHLADLAAQTQARVYRCDASEPAEVDALFRALNTDLGAPDVVVYNPSARVRGPLTELDAAAVQQALMVTCFGGFLVGQAAARAMLKRGSGSILFTGATASVKGFPHSASFAMGKFGLRGLAQSMARELAPKNIHVAHFVIDGAIGVSSNDERLHPDAIAAAYLFAHRQQRSAWTWEFELRPWVERF
jgi:NAD(P)-dependent dehydrogenase (short-subunit alcohol dehydrogenase family)